MTPTPSTTSDKADVSTDSPIVDPLQLLRFQLKQWRDLNRLLSEQNAAEPLHTRYNDIEYCQDRIQVLEVDILQFSHHFE